MAPRDDRTAPGTVWMVGFALQMSPIGDWTGVFADSCPIFRHWTAPIVLQTCSLAKRTTGLGKFPYPDPVGRRSREAHFNPHGGRVNGRVFWQFLTLAVWPMIPVTIIVRPKV